MELKHKCEAVLFVAGKPLTAKALAKALGAKEKEIRDALDELKTKYNVDASGIRLVLQENSAQLVTDADAREFVEQFVKIELTGDLTRPQLETLSIVAYRGPINKPHIEELRGVNCSLILRNLLIRGLIEEQPAQQEDLPAYNVTVAFLNHLGIQSVSQLPNYEQLRLQSRSYETAPLS